jgi:hypothetical protein
MAFERESLYCAGPDAGLNRIWLYQTTDGPETVAAAGYFRAARDEFRVGDVVMVTVLSSGIITRLAQYVVTSRDNATVTVENLTGSTLGAGVGVYSVLDEGASPNNSTPGLPPFQRTIGKIATRAGVMRIDISYPISGVATPGYYVGGDWYPSIGTAAEAIPGGVTDWRGRVILQSGPLVVPHGHWIDGKNAVPTNDQAPGGAELWAAGGYTGTGNRLVQLLPSNNTGGGDHTRIDHLLINGRDALAGLIGIWSDSIQENSGAFDFCIRGCDYGVVLQAAAGISPANFSFERGHIVMSTGTAAAFDGFQCFGTKGNIKKITCVNTRTTDTGDSAFVFRGSDHYGENLHFEGFDYGATIGGPAAGVGVDNGTWDFDIRLNGLHGYNLSTQPGLRAAARIRGNSASVFNIKVEDVTINELYAWAASTAYTVGQRRTISTSRLVMLECTVAGTSGGAEPAVGTPGGTVVDGTVTWQYVYTALVLDEVNNIIIPASLTSRQLMCYEFGGTVGRDAGGTTVRPVHCTYYNHLGAQNDALMAKVLDGATTQDVDRGFAAGGNAGIIQFRGTAGGAAEEIRTLSDPQHGDQCYFHCVDPVTIRHNAAGGTAAHRFHCATGADINAGRDTFWRATYGDPRGSNTWTGPLSALNATFDRWYVEQVV